MSWWEFIAKEFNFIYLPEVGLSENKAGFVQNVKHDTCNLNVPKF